MSGHAGGVTYSYRASLFQLTRLNGLYNEGLLYISCTPWHKLLQLCTAIEER